MEAPEAIFLFIVFAFAIFLGVVQMNAEEDNRNATPIALNQLISLAKLGGHQKWSVTIVRRSGFVHDAWTITGSAQNAIDSATVKMRQAKIFDVRIRENTSTKFDVLAFYDSAGNRRTGKYVGGFIITAET